MRIRRADDAQEVPVLSRIDTPIEVEYYRRRDLPYVLRQILARV